METAARLRYARISPYKVRLVVDKIRGASVERAFQTLDFLNKRSAVTVKKVLQSAVANAENNDGADIDELYVSKAFVDQGPALKRIRARAKGRANRILKRTSHITIIVSNTKRKESE